MMTERQKKMNQHENADAAISYAMGCASMALGWVCNATELWQAIALFLGVIVILIRVLHDGLRFYRSLRYGGKK